MSPSTRRRAWFPVLAAVTCALLAGCVDRRFIITSELGGNPVPAEVYINNRRVGITPADYQFVYYGTYRIVLQRDGCQTLVVDQPVRPPWFEWPPLDFFSEIIPWNIRDERRLNFKLEPIVLLPPEGLLNRGEQVRSKGATLGAPIGAVPVVPPAAPAGVVQPVAPSVLPPPAGPGVVVPGQAPAPTWTPTGPLPPPAQVPVVPSSLNGPSASTPPPR